MTKQIINIATVSDVNNYPYGRLQCTAFFSTEFKDGKGFRSVFQTINPKNGRLNAPKKSTYYHFACDYVHPETGHIKQTGYTMWGYEGIVKCFTFVSENFDSLGLTKEMVIYLMGTAYTCIRGNVTYSENASQVLEILKPAILKTLEGFKTGNNVFAEVAALIDMDAIMAANKPEALTA